MGVISAHNNVEFEKPNFLISKVKRNLRSYDQAGLIDENDFYEDIMFILDQLGIGGLLEESAIIEITNGRGVLPENYKMPYSVNICQASSWSSHPRPQNGYVFYTDTTYEDTVRSNCRINCPTVTCGQKVTVREYIQGLEQTYDFTIDRGLNIVPDKERLSPSEVCFRGRQFIRTGMKEGTIFLKYYAYPICEDTGLPLIPKVESIQKALEFYLMLSQFLKFYWNDDVPNGITQKMADVERRFNEAFSLARLESKHPSFLGAVDSIRKQRNSLRVYQQTNNN